MLRPEREQRRGGPDRGIDKYQKKDQKQIQGPGLDRQYETRTTDPRSSVRRDGLGLKGDWDTVRRGPRQHKDQDQQQLTPTNSSTNTSAEEVSRRMRNLLRLVSSSEASTGAYSAMCDWLSCQDPPPPRVGLIERQPMVMMPFPFAIVR